MTKTEKLRLEIAKKYCEGLGGDDWQHSGIEQRIFYGTFANHILKLCQEAGLAFVVKDAELPENPHQSHRRQHRKSRPLGLPERVHAIAQNDMLKAGWRKTEEIEV